MDPAMFLPDAPGRLVSIDGVHPRRGAWCAWAFLPDPIPAQSPQLSGTTYNQVADARAALATLGARASVLPNPSLLRRPTLRVEAQSTSALEGTFAPLDAVLGADEEEEQPDATLREVVNYVLAAEYAFGWVSEGRALTLSLVEDLQRRLVRATAADTVEAGRVRRAQVAIGSGRVEHARYVPPPPGLELEALAADCVRWMSEPVSAVFDPVVAAAIGHYQFEALHPFNDGNGRIGRLLIVLQLLRRGALTEPTLSVSPWFEARRPEYYDRLRAVSTDGAWDEWVRFFARGVEASARSTQDLLQDLVDIQSTLKERLRALGFRAGTAYSLVDYAIGQSIFTVRQAARHLDVTYARANKLVGQLVDAGVLAQRGHATYDRRFGSPDVLDVLNS